MRFHNRNYVARLTTVLALLAVGGAKSAVADESKNAVELRHTTDFDQVTKVEAALEVAGELKFRNGDQIKTLPTVATAKMLYDERFLPTDQAMAAPRQSVRVYRAAEAVIQVEKEPTKAALGEARRTVVARETESQVEMFSPAGPLTFDELELIQIPGNSLLADQLLPGKAVATGEAWQHADALLAGLLNLDAVSKSDVSSKLIGFDDTAARVELAGAVSGALGGVATEIELTGRYKFDRAAGRITWLALLVKEKRAIGHVEPGVEVTARVQMTITPVAEPAELSAEQLGNLDLSGGPEALRVAFESQDGYRFEHDRNWHVMADNGEVLSLRMVERGELVAQCNVTAVPLLDVENRPTLEQFQNDIRRSLGAYFGQFTRATESQNSLGYVTYRIEAVGRVEEIDITWFYYLVQGPERGQVVFAFTCEQPMLERLADADQTIVSTLRFVVPTTAAQASGIRR